MLTEVNVKGSLDIECQLLFYIIDSNWMTILKCQARKLLDLYTNIIYCYNIMKLMNYCQLDQYVDLFLETRTIKKNRINFYLSEI